MPQPLSGPGVGLQLPQYLYPSELTNAPYDLSQNYLSLSPGDTLPIPAGNWYVNVGMVSVLQYLDPLTGIWRIPRGGQRNMPQYVKSDGFNWRVANLTGCPVGAVITNAGTAYVESTTTVVAGTGNSTWQAIVGGLVSYTSMSNFGGGYGVPPLVFLTPPPQPGVQATAIATIGTGGSVSGITMVNAGAGYDTAPTAVILPSPTDPNINSGITQAVAVMGQYGGTSASGSLSAILCTNPGVSIASVPTLTIAGGGSSGAATALRMSTMTAGSVTGAGVGFGTTGSSGLATVGGGSAATAVNVNPEIELTNFIPRPASATLAASGGSLASIGTIFDSGLFVGTPTVIVQAGSGAAPSTAATVTLTLGGANDTVLLQPAP